MFSLRANLEKSLDSCYMLVNVKKKKKKISHEL